MAPTIQTKLIDSSKDISNGGRAEKYWISQPVKRDLRFDTDKQPDVVDQFAVIKKYSLKGFEYGNWVSNNDRNDRLSATLESCEDLAVIIGSKNIGFDGTVGIAFGARGQSKFAAHFEPWSFMINLTRERGFGCLAHEYGHALDYFFGMYVDQYADSASLSGGDSLRMHIEPFGGALRYKTLDLINKVIQDNGKKSATYIRWKKAFEDEYWFRRNEIFARTFEQWIRYKMDKKGIKNTFLSQKKYENAAYLLPADFKRIEPLMSGLIKEMAQFMNNKKKAVSKPARKMKIAAKRK